MSEAFGPLAALVMAFFGCGFLGYALLASRTALRIVRMKTSRIADVAPGPAEIAGELRSPEPLVAFDGTPVVAYQRTFKYSYVDDSNEGYSSMPVISTACAPVEVTDESGACLVTLDTVILLGPSNSYKWSGRDFAEKYPEIVEQVLKPDAKETLTGVTATEIVVPDGVRGFLSGEVHLGEKRSQGEGYRDGKRRFQLRGTDDLPLVVSAWEERHVVRSLLHPLFRVAAVGILCLIAAAWSVVLPQMLSSRAGL